ncbi:hypothetical protein BG015_001640 [Linnemannia schmuckeri]|uniref:FAD-binding domain-containing protein n=1 Tax=Linnemannia schmuckeri TaxID=64567 RepID=A0A9P5S642_9FUNG|nr:hypothetical protein BG015_001640 [Linnemannia schmuckeri]
MASTSSTATITTEKPKVVIVGAGLGGLMLGALLERCNIPYVIVEKAAVVKPLGSALTIGSTLIPLFEQLGIAEDLYRVGKPWTHYNTYSENRELILAADFSLAQGLTGYTQYAVGRSALYDVLLNQIPSHKIHFGKRVTSINDNGDNVEVRTRDGSNFEGDILVGADGAYSAVRQQLYRILLKEGKLPASDQEELPFSCVCLVGQTRPLDPEEFPVLKEPLAQFKSTLGNNNAYSWIINTTSYGSICWMCMLHLEKVANRSTYNDKKSRTSENLEWDSHAAAAKAMCDETRHFPLPFGDGTLTMGDMYDRTDQDLISKVMLEEKVFETWHSGRTVLLGDACHKLHVSGGRGAITSMHDAIALANLLYALPPNPTSSDIHQLFSEYRSERYPIVQATFKNSQMMSKATDKGIFAMFTRFLLKHMPTVLWKKFIERTVVDRPQVGFLEQVPMKGTVIPSVSPSALKARAVYEQKGE